MSAAPKQKSIFEYNDYHEVLLDWMKGRSLRQNAKILNVSPSFLSLVVRHKRNFSPSVVEQWANEMGLKTDEKAFLHRLANLSGSSTLHHKKEAYRSLKKCKSYETMNQADLVIHEYLSNWYCVAIREMAHLPEFQFDAKWIQERLVYRVSISNINAALRFLTRNGFIDRQNEIKAQGAVFRLAQAEFHEQMANLGLRSFFETEKDMRKLLGKTVALTDEQFKSAKSLLDQAFQAIQAMADASEKKAGKRVVHFLTMQFPLTEEIPNKISQIETKSRNKK